MNDLINPEPLNKKDLVEALEYEIELLRKLTKEQSMKPYNYSIAMSPDKWNELISLMGIKE